MLDESNLENQLNEDNINIIEEDNKDEEIDLNELESLLFDSSNNVYDHNNFCVYVSPTQLNNGFYNFRTINEAIKYITELNQQEYTKQYQINLLPGVYNETFTLPSYINLIGSGKELTRINLSGENDLIVLCSDTSISNLSIYFDNILELDNLVLLDINSRKYDSKLEIQKKNIEANKILSYELDKNKYILSKKIKLQGVDIYVDNFVSGYIINIANGKLEINDCNIVINSIVRNEIVNFENNDLDETDLQKIEDIDVRYIHILKIDISELSLFNSKIILNTDVLQSYIINCEIATININNSILTVNNNNYTKIYKDYNYLIYNVFSSIHIYNSSFLNKRYQGKIFFLDCENFIGKEQIINNFTIKDRKITIKTFLPNLADNKILMASDGFIYKNKKYIFSNKHILDSKMVLDIDISSDCFDDIEYENNIKVFCLYKLEIINSNLEENSDNSQFVDDYIFPENYIVRLSNTNLVSKNFYGLINKITNDNMLEGTSIDIKGDIITSKNIYSEKIISDGILLENLGIKKYFNNDYEVYSLLYKPSKLGNYSIDLSYPYYFNFIQNYDFLEYDKYGSIGNMSFTLGYKNLSEGELSLTGGYNCHSYGFGSFSYGLGTYTYEDFGFTIGKFNTNFNKEKNRLFTIGNGIDSENRSDALVVYDDGRIMVQKSILADTFTDGISYLSDGNLLGLNNLEAENIIIDEDINVNGDLLGKKEKIENYEDNICVDILSTFSKKITTIKLNLNNLIIPVYGKIIGIKDEICSLYDFKEVNNGMIYQIEITCIEEVDTEIGFLLSEQYNDLKLGANIQEWENFDDSKNIIIFDQVMKKGERLKKKFNICLYNNFSLYIFNKNKNGSKSFNSGKFIITFTGDFF